MSSDAGGRAEPVVDASGVLLETGLWRDSLGYVGPMQPGSGPRSNPLGLFPTGPDIGEMLPSISGASFDGTTVDVHRDREAGPAVVSFLRSAVW